MPQIFPALGVTLQIGSCSDFLIRKTLFHPPSFHLHSWVGVRIIQCTIDSFASKLSLHLLQSTKPKPYPLYFWGHSMHTMLSPDLNHLLSATKSCLYPQKCSPLCSLCHILKSSCWYPLYWSMHYWVPLHYDIISVPQKRPPPRHMSNLPFSTHPTSLHPAFLHFCPSRQPIMPFPVSRGCSPNPLTSTHTTIRVFLG